MSPKQISRAKFLENAELQKKLLTYSAAASLVAAGGLMPMSAARAAHTVVWEGPQTVDDPNGKFAVDFDQNSTPEFTLRVSTSYIDAFLFNQSVSFLGQTPGVRVYPYALAQDDPVSAAAGPWRQPVGRAILTTDTGSTGYWINLTGMHYLGVRFQSGGGTHYGWVELTCTDGNDGGPQLIVHRYGWDDTADDGIPAAVTLAGGEAASGGSWLQAVVAGSFAALSGVLAWLRRRVGRRLKRDTA